MEAQRSKNAPGVESSYHDGTGCLQVDGDTAKAEVQVGSADRSDVRP